MCPTPYQCFIKRSSFLVGVEVGMEMPALKDSPFTSLYRLKTWSCKASTQHIDVHNGKEHRHDNKTQARTKQRTFKPVKMGRGPSAKGSQRLL